MRHRRDCSSLSLGAFFAVVRISSAVRACGHSCAVPGYGVFLPVTSVFCAYGCRLPCTARAQAVVARASRSKRDPRRTPSLGHIKSSTGFPSCRRDPMRSRPARYSESAALTKRGACMRSAFRVAESLFHLVLVFPSGQPIPSPRKSFATPCLLCKTYKGLWRQRLDSK